MKYVGNSVILTTLALSGAAVRAAKAGGKQEQPAEAASSALWKYFGYDKNQTAPAVSADAKGERDEPWMLITEDEDDFVFTEEAVTKDEIKSYNEQAKEQDVKRYDEDRLARVKEAEEDEALRAWALPREPKVSARWYQRAAPVLEVGEAIMVDSESDDEPSHEQIMQMLNAEEAILVESEPEDQQPGLAEEMPQPPPMEDDMIPDAPLMDNVTALHVPASEGARDVEEPKQPSLFRGKQAKQIGVVKSDESSVSAEETALLQQFRTMFQGAQSREGRQQVVESMKQFTRENPGFLALHELSMQLFLRVQREAIQDDSGSDSDEVPDFA